MEILDVLAVAWQSCESLNVAWLSRLFEDERMTEGKCGQFVVSLGGTVASV